MFYRVTIRIETYDNSNPDISPMLIDQGIRYERSYDTIEEAKRFSNLLETEAVKIAKKEEAQSQSDQGGESPADQGGEPAADQGGEPAVDQGGEPAADQGGESPADQGQGEISQTKTDLPKGNAGKVSKSESVTKPKGESGIS